MNRRELVVIGSAAAAVATLPSFPALAKQRIFWGPGALANPHAELVLDWIEETMREGKMYAKQDWYIDLILELRDPVFHVRADKPVWNYITGYTDERGLSITLVEKGIEVATVGILSTHGSSSLTIPERYHVKTAWIPYENRVVNEALKDQLKYDMRWLEVAAKQLKTLGTKVNVTV
jgi:hypothetical protein